MRPFADMYLLLMLPGLLRFVFCLAEALSGCLLQPLTPSVPEIKLLQKSLGSKMVPRRVCTHTKTQKRASSKPKCSGRSSTARTSCSPRWKRRRTRRRRRLQDSNASLTAVASTAMMTTRMPIAGAAEVVVVVGAGAVSGRILRCWKVSVAEFAVLRNDCNSDVSRGTKTNITSKPT